MLRGLSRLLRRERAGRDGNADNVVTLNQVSSSIEVYRGAWENGKFLHCAVDDEGFLVWPDDPHEVPAWRIERELHASITGSPLPSYRTRAEAEQWGDIIAISTPVGLAPPLSVDEAAAQFTEDLRHPSEVREYSAQELTDLYLSFCAERNLQPSPIDSVKASMVETVPGVHRSIDDRKKNKVRSRKVRWIIEPVDEIQNEDSTDQVQLRMAA